MTWLYGIVQQRISVSEAEKMKSYVKMKTSGDLAWTDKIDLNASFAKALNGGRKSSEETVVQEKIAGLRAKLLSGARLSGTEKII